MISKNLIAASTRPILLAILARGENYGYQLIQTVKEFSGGKLEWSDGMLYPVLHRLEKEGLIISSWIMSDEGRLRKYYRLTEAGREELVEEREQWLSVHETLVRIWRPLQLSD
jgi:DNA-binding PadR family transcriptional regulator